MLLTFYKYHGAGNDFILIDDRERSFPQEKYNLVAHLCDRRFGIGADGLMLLRMHSEYDFEMVYYNSDGRESSMCGNGGRCIAAFAARSGIIEKTTTFLAVDGPHHAIILEPAKVRLQMINVNDIEIGTGYYYLNTGSPHYVVFRDDTDKIDIIPEAHKIRYNERFAKDGVNVNFVRFSDGMLNLRTYERGVENETLACGTGAVATAICAAIKSSYEKKFYILNVKGGQLKVDFEITPAKHFENIWLEGGAEFVFTGKIEI